MAAASDVVADAKATKVIPSAQKLGEVVENVAKVAEASPAVAESISKIAAVDDGDRLAEDIAIAPNCVAVVEQ